MITITLLDLVNAIADQSDSDEEIVATVIHLVNSKQVVLGGSFRGAEIDLDTFRDVG
jgi:hypothetical protein